ncbi:13648_t:CDS:2 [Gigaspora rosea]|nr:13648_t:CDS:2 [Gigaspora rosea]
MNLINSYVDLLKNVFAPREEAEEIFDTYLNLIYGSESANHNRKNTNSDYDYKLLSDELWLVSSNILLITMFLDPHFKDFE